jgi:hypothetical protein
MAIYRVHIPAGGADPASLADRVSFQREGLSWTGLLFGPIWLLMRGLWRALALWCLGAAIIAFAVSLGRLSASAEFWLYFLSALFIGLEGRNLAAAAAERRGSRLGDIVAAADRDAAERGFFSRWLAAAPAAPAASGPAARPTAPVGEGHVIGLFPEAGG